MKRVLRSIVVATAFVATCVAAQAADLPMPPRVPASSGGHPRLQLDGILYWRERWLRMGQSGCIQPVDQPV